MCQLLGMNCNVPTDICFSFEGFSKRGGETDHHSDGWGIAFFEGKGVRIFLDSKSTIDSPIAELVKRYPIHSLNVIAHIRKATQGVVALENSHPFIRELWGKYWIFAHNGNLTKFDPAPFHRYRPVGTTDSERAFCYILEGLCRQFPDSEPELPVFYDALSNLTQELSAHGTFNYLLSNGDYLFAHCSTQLSYIIRQAPWPVAHLVDDDIAVDFSTLTGARDRVAIITTVPLTDNETWTQIPQGRLLVFKDGAPLQI